MSFLRKSFSTFQRRVKSAGAASAMGVAVLVAVIAPCPAAAANTDFCAGKTLDAGAPLGSPGPDLVITGTACTVDGSYKTYNFHNVYIFGGGSLVSITRPWTFTPRTSWCKTTASCRPPESAKTAKC